MNSSRSPSNVVARALPTSPITRAVIFAVVVVMARLYQNSRG
jgi:hypothetical protein